MDSLTRRSILASASAAGILPGLSGCSANASEGKQLVVPRSQYFDIASKITGRTYRIMVATPYNADPSTAYPVLYVLDGNHHFRMAADESALLVASGNSGPAVVVGIGYPTDDIDDVGKMRAFDLTPSVSKDPHFPADIKTGGGDAFLEAIEREIKPSVAVSYKMDKSKQALYGHSFGGLMVLRQLLRNPNAFSTYIISSPSIWWNDKEILSDEAAFSRRVRQHEVHGKILITSAGDEQSQTGRDAETRMVDNASELAERLAVLDPVNMPVTRTIFSGETHGSVPPSSLIRGIRFAFPPKS